MRILLLVVLIIQISSISYPSMLFYNYNQYSSKSVVKINSISTLSISDVLKIISFPKTLPMTNTSSNITIAIIDSGINKSLIPNYWINRDEIPNNSIDDDHNGFIDDYYGWDFVTNHSVGYEGNYSSHGTFISNIISNMVENKSNIKIMDIRVLNFDNINSNYNAFINAIEYALSFKNLKVIQFSIEFLNSILSVYPPALHWIFTKAFLRHVVIITVSGNDESSQISDPGNWPETIAVTSVDKVANSWKKSSYANTGPNIDISVPGTSIQSVSVNGLPLILSGTSFSAAFVGGAITLFESLYYSENMSVSTIRALLQSSAYKLHDCNQFGAGLLNITNFLSLGDSANYTDYTDVCPSTYSVPTTLGSFPTSKTLDNSVFFSFGFITLFIISKGKIKKLKR